jgi:molybdopterin-guanine dinucleotide biosynthesis protein A
MGADKAFLDVEGRPLVAFVLEGLVPLFDEILLCGPAEGNLKKLRHRVVADRSPGRGPLSGLQSALEEAAHERIFLCACDMPFPEPALIRHLYALSLKRSVVVPQTPDGLEPLFAFYHRDCLPRIGELIDGGRLSIHRLPFELDAEVVPFADVQRFDPRGRSFKNINAPSDLRELRNRIRAVKGREKGFSSDGIAVQ